MRIINKFKALGMHNLLQDEVLYNVKTPTQRIQLAAEKLEEGTEKRVLDELLPAMERSWAQQHPQHGIAASNQPSSHGNVVVSVRSKDNTERQAP